jgi:proteasome lid subunit RPN8/RPN11
MKYSSNKIINVLNTIKQWSHENHSTEICGFVGFSENKYHAELGKNIAQDPRSFFCLDPIQYLNFKDEHELLFCFHSHVVGDENFSEFDIKMSEHACLPFLVYSLNTKKFNIYCPQNHDLDVNKIQRFKEKI